MKIVFSANDIKPQENETYRYLGYKKNINNNYDVSEQIKEKTKELILEVQKILKPQCVFEFYPIDFLTNNNIKSQKLNNNLTNCSYVIILAATIGPMVDKLILQYQNKSSSSALIIQAIGAMFIESFVDFLCKDFAQEALKNGYKLKPRFSPGFGDLSLENQKKIFSFLRCSQQIGLTLNDSLVMSPEKSVTAFIGLEKIL